MDLEDIKELYSSGLIKMGSYNNSFRYAIIEREELKKVEKNQEMKLYEVAGKKPVLLLIHREGIMKSCREVVGEVGYKFAVSTESG